MEGKKVIVYVPNSVAGSIVSADKGVVGVVYKRRRGYLLKFGEDLYFAAEELNEEVLKTIKLLTRDKFGEWELTLTS